MIRHSVRFRKFFSLVPIIRAELLEWEWHKEVHRKESSSVRAGIKMFTYHLILICISFLAIISCQEVDPSKAPQDLVKVESPPDKPPRESIMAQELPDNMKIQIQGTDPEKYAVQFSWPYLEDEKVLRIRLGSVLAEVLPSQTFFTHILSHNQNLTFSFDVLDKNHKPEYSFNKTIQIPMDLVVKADNFNIKQNQKIEVNRLYLSNEFPLTINEYSVNITTNELHAERGFVQTFPEKVKVRNSKSGLDDEISPTASFLKEGRSGGTLSINSKKLFGRLRIFMRGEAGGQGPKGDAKPQNSQAGAAAGAGILSVDVGRVFSFRFSCIKYGSPGLPGAKGEDGNTGGMGKRGGNSGDVRVSIQEYVPVEGVDKTYSSGGNEVVEIFQVPGKGGLGGPGGDGQRGGPGGQGRNPRDQLDCRGDSGPEGAPGNSGAEGRPGEEGKVGQKCIHVRSKNISECSN